MPHRPGQDGRRTVRTAARGAAGASSPLDRARVVVVSGPSGAGKGTVIQRVLQRVPGLALAVSATTRPARPGEVDGVDYRFLDAAEFERRVAAGEFLEHVDYAGNRYGTLYEEVERHLRAGRSVIVEIELRGARAVKRAIPDAILVFIKPPSYEALEARLVARGTDSREEIATRMQVSQDELAAVGEFTHVILNEDVDTAVDELTALLRGEGGRAG